MEDLSLSSVPRSIISHRWPLSRGLRTRLPEFGSGVDTMWCALPRYFLVVNNTAAVFTDKVYLPTIVSGRVILHLGYTRTPVP